MVKTRTLENGTEIKYIDHQGVVKSINDKVLTLNNAKKTPYQIGTVGIKYPNGSSEDIVARFYTNSIAKHPDTFKSGEKIGLEIQADGMYAGRAVAKLPGGVANVALLLGSTTVEEASEYTAASELNEEVSNPVATEV